MRTRITAVLAAVLVISGVFTGVAYAPPDPEGPGTQNGLCNAYFRGSENGREHKRNGRAFQALEEAAGVEADDDAAERAEKVASFCGD